MAYRGPAGLPEPPGGKDIEQYEVFHVAGERLTCWVHKEALKMFREQGPLPDGAYLFFAEGAGRLRLYFEDGLP